MSEVLGHAASPWCPADEVMTIHFADRATISARLRNLCYMVAGIFPTVGDLRRIKDGELFELSAWGRKSVRELRAIIGYSGGGAPEAHFKTGDLVQLKSGGPVMVADSDFRGDGLIECYWFAGETLQRDAFDPRCLKFAEPA